MNTPHTVPLGFKPRTPQEMLSRSAGFLDEIRRRRTVRDFSDRPVDREVMLNATAAGAS